VKSRIAEEQLTVGQTESPRAAPMFASPYPASVASMKSKIALAGTLLGIAGTTHAWDAEDWPTHYRFGDGTDVGISGNYEGDFNSFSGTEELKPSQRATLQDSHGARREEFSVFARKPGVYDAQWGWDYWNKSYVDVYFRFETKALFHEDYGKIRFGYTKTYVGFEGFTRTRNDSFLEAALPIQAFYEGRRTGVDWEFERSSWRLDLAAYGGQDLQGDNDGTTITGRLAWTPLKQRGDVLHLGVSVSEENPDASTIDGLGRTVIPSLRARARPDVFLTATRFVDTGTLTHVDRIDRAGLEGLWIHGPWSLQGEWLGQDVRRTGGMSSVQGSGFYVFGSWVVTGESRPYENGNVGNLKPAGTWGAVELLARYDEVDLDDPGAGVRGGREHNWTLGANWYLLTHFRLQANYIWVHASGNPAFNGGKTIDPQIFGLRAQVVF
jgi:phosphate-selective porin OprO/OprP